MADTAYQAIVQRTQEFSEKIKYFSDNLEESLDVGDMALSKQRGVLFKLGHQLADFIRSTAIEANNDPLLISNNLLTLFSLPCLIYSILPYPAFLLPLTYLQPLLKV